MTALLDLVRERIDGQLEEARSSVTLSHLGLWLGVFEQGQPWKPPDGLRQYSGVAEAAMVCASREDADARRYFTDGVEWLRRRRFFVPGQSKSLEADPLACVAIGAGIQAHGLTTDAQWIADIAERAISEEHDLQRIDLFRLARAIGIGADASWSEVSPVIKVACARRLGRQPGPEEHRRAFEQIMSPVSIDPERAVFYRAALQSIFAVEATIDLVQPTIDQVVQLLRGLSAALKRWPWEEKGKTQHRNVTAQRWDVQHEYHVQSLVWAILRPVFPGLEDEENLPSLGPKHPRADLLVPGLRLVIEIKFLREATQAARANIIEEIAADAGIYRTTGSGYDAIIALIWDATGSTNHHAEIEAGIRKLQGITDVVMISRPGEWK